ncbi:unnamed protein product [Paramecium pentaurelia]|uniref:Uncharacterized protein n=1 Tax=Paramecium pentaurelia TaxID=43138 RepID=A0A8S1YL43_9CILI|nr:unnamed protein product [Paramecium pentaurelia]
MNLRPQPGHQNKNGINPITNTPIDYAQRGNQQPYYKQPYPQPPIQYTQNPQQYQNPYYNQTLPQVVQQTMPEAGQKLPLQSDAIELDHMNGFSGRYRDVIHLHPQKESTIVYALAGLIVIENLNDKHQQLFLRGHDMDISALTLSKTGRYIASGQMGSRNSKTPEAPVILWDFNARKPMQIFRGLRDEITNLSFSSDDKFLAATASNNNLIIWNCQDYTIVHNKLLEVPINLITWCPPRRSSTKHSQYLIVTSQGSNIFLNTMDFDVASMQYQLKQAPCQLPSSGLVRNYTKAVIDANGDYLYVGTHAGEICIFSISSQQGGIFKATIPISNNGVLSINIFGKNLFVGSGDGKVKKLTGSDTRWNLERELCLEGRMNSITIDPNGNELLAGTSNGRIYRINTAHLDSSVHTEGHQSSIVGLSVPLNACDLFVSIDYEGVVMVWDMNEMLVITRCIPINMNRVKGSSVYLDPDRTIISGWRDGFIRAYMITNKPVSPIKWEIVNAHKGAVTTLYSDQNYYLSGGEDSIIRVWSKTARQLITQISIHSKEITKVFPDLMKPNFIHSCSADKTIYTYDLKTDKKVIQHQSRNGVLLDMTQRKDNELELITCGINMPIQFWDIDIVEPVQSIDVTKLNSIAISPDGKILATGSDSGELILISILTQSILGKYLGHSSGVSKVAWTSDQKQVITTSYDGTVCLWNIYL